MPVTSVILTVKSMINPFENATGDLAAISSGAVTINAVKDDLLNAEAKGEAAPMEFMKGRLLVGTGAKPEFHDAIKKLKLKHLLITTQAIRKIAKK